MIATQEPFAPKAQKYFFQKLNPETAKHALCKIALFFTTTFNFSASGKIFEKVAHQIATRGRPAPRAEVALLFLAGEPGPQIGTGGRPAPRAEVAFCGRRAGGGGTGHKSSNPTHGGWGTSKFTKPP